MEKPSAQPIIKERWDELAPTFRDTSYRQASSYALAAARRVGATSELMQVVHNQEIVGLAEVRVKRFPLVSLGIAYSNHAPLVIKDEQSYERAFGGCLDALRDEYVERRGLVFRITPPLNGGLLQDIQFECLRARGFYQSSRPTRQTFIVDLARPLEEIRRGLNPKWRSDLKRSEVAGLTIVRSIDLADFDQFNRIFINLAIKKRFMPSQDVTFFKSVQSTAPPDQKLVLHLAWHDGDLIAGHLGSYVGSTSVYLLGASTAKGRELRASYLLQWAAICYGKEIGNSFYDLGGVDQIDNPDVYRFKSRLNGRLVSEVGPYELAPGALRKRAVQFFEDAGRNLKARV